MNKQLKQLLVLVAVAIGLVAANAALAADAKAALEQDKVCTACHDASWDKPILAIYQTRHGVKGDGRTPGCRTCHGVSDKHLESPSNSPDVVFSAKSNNSAEAKNEVCQRCHLSGTRINWVGSKHQSLDVTCATCHTVHAAKDKVRVKVTQAEVCFGCHKTERAETLRMSTHPIAAAKVVCSDCHNPHGSDGPKLMLENTIRDTCFTCHAEKRGPFLWEHPSAMDDCMNCHTPHGSTTAPLLKARQPWLCQECHGDGAPHPGNLYSGGLLPGGNAATVNQTGAINPITGQPSTANAPAAQLAFRGCTGCHVQVHGSNDPAGQRFVR